MRVEPVADEVEGPLWEGLPRMIMKSFTSDGVMQQDLKRCRLRVEPLCASGFLLLIALLYSILSVSYGGANLKYATSEYKLDYTDNCTESRCIQHLRIANGLPAPIGLYYSIHHYYVRTSRWTAKSYDPLMLRGGIETVEAEDLDYPKCWPEVYLDEMRDESNLLIPCGSAARSVFNDSFYIAELPDFNSSAGRLNLVIDSRLFRDANESYQEGVHWLHDSGLFVNQTDPHFIAWMRRPAFVPFRKLWGWLDSPLEPKNYTFVIRNLWNISGVRKQVVLAPIGSGTFGTLRYGPVIVFGSVTAVTYVSALVLGVIGWLRRFPESPYHASKLELEQILADLGHEKEFEAAY